MRERVSEGRREGEKGGRERGEGKFHTSNNELSITISCLATLNV